jgi:hypothetical protein
MVRGYGPGWWCWDAPEIERMKCEKGVVQCIRREFGSLLLRFANRLERFLE